MLNTKLNLYNPDWIELVFANRNKSYGAFELRQHYSSTMVKAMGIAFTSVVAAALLYNVSLKKVENIAPKLNDHETVVHLDKLKLEKPVEPVKPAAPSKPAPPVTTTILVPMVVTPEPVNTDPPKNIDINGEVGQITAKGSGTVVPVEDPPATSGGGGVEPVVDNTIHNTGGLEVMPEPVGGAAAWSKFLSRNLRFPAQAQDAGKSGRVLVSFVIEKDGRLSDIVVQNGAGYGMDEEALRVLKLAKPWKPGMQNGQPVRVRYTIPMNFQLSEY